MAQTNFQVNQTYRKKIMETEEQVVYSILETVKRYFLMTEKLMKE
jgi:hypothetical protein